METQPWTDRQVFAQPLCTYLAMYYYFGAGRRPPLPLLLQPFTIAQAFLPQFPHAPPVSCSYSLADRMGQVQLLPVQTGFNLVPFFCLTLLPTYSQLVSICVLLWLWAEEEPPSSVPATAGCLPPQAVEGAYAFTDPTP